MSPGSFRAGSRLYLSPFSECHCHFLRKLGCLFPFCYGPQDHVPALFKAMDTRALVPSLRDVAPLVCLQWLCPTTHIMMVTIVQIIFKFGLFLWRSAFLPQFLLVWKVTAASSSQFAPAPIDSIPQHPVGLQARSPLLFLAVLKSMAKSHCPLPT